MSLNKTQQLIHKENAETIQQLFNQALAARPDKAYQEFLDFVIRFNHFSLFNTMMIYTQRPGASAVGTRKQWKKINRSLKPDALPIVILQPFGPIRYVFELGDTEGAPIQGHDAHPLRAFGNLSPATWDRVVKNANRYGIAVEKVSYGEQYVGSAAKLRQHKNSGERISIGETEGWRVRINQGSDDTTQFATLAHELGHIYCGHLGYHPKDHWADCSDLSLAMQEIEAETVSYLVCERANIQTRSAQYLMDYIQAEQVANININRIMAAAQKVEARTDTLTESNAALKPKPEPPGQMSIFGRAEMIDLPLFSG